MMNDIIFPNNIPEIKIIKLDIDPFEVDCRELHWWFVIPEAGQFREWSIYDYPSKTLTSVTRTRTTAKAVLHSIDCYEISVDEWTNQNNEWILADRIFYARVTNEYTQWLGEVHSKANGTKVINTFLDEEFAPDWSRGENNIGDKRIIIDENRFTIKSDGTLSQKRRESLSPGCGIFEVSIGSKIFTCLRVLEPNKSAGTLIEAYITKEGKTILLRRYNEKNWAVGASKYYKEPWDVMYPLNEKLIVDGLTYIHWYDCLTDTSFNNPS